jgi:hypothetical protein
MSELNENDVTIKQRLALPTPAKLSNLGNLLFVLGGAIASIAALPMIPANIAAVLITGGSIFGILSKVLLSTHVDWNQVDLSTGTPVVLQPTYSKPAINSDTNEVKVVDTQVPAPKE